MFSIQSPSTQISITVQTDMSHRIPMPIPMPISMAIPMPMVIGATDAVVIWKALKAIKHKKTWSGIN